MPFNHMTHVGPSKRTVGGHLEIALPKVNFVSDVENQASLGEGSKKEIFIVSNITLRSHIEMSKEVRRLTGAIRRD